MGLFEYISVLTSIIIGLGIAHLLKGIARLVQHPGRHKVYWVHLVWVAFMFFNMIFWWWWQFNLNLLDAWYFQNYLFVILYAVVLYLCCALLFPSEMDDYSGYEDYFISRRYWFCGLISATFVIDLYDTWLKGAEHFQNAGTEYLIASLIQFVLVAFAAYTKNRYYHAVVAVAALAYQASWAFSFTLTVG